MEQARELLDSSKDALGAVTNMSLDTIILIALFVIFLGYGFRYGKYRMVALILSLYIIIPVFNIFPYKYTITFLGEFYSQVGIFLIILILLNVIISKVISEEFSSRGLRPLVVGGLLSASVVGLLLVISYHILPIESVYNFAAPIDALFSSTQLFFWWLVAPLAVLLFTVRR